MHLLETQESGFADMKRAFITLNPRLDNYHLKRGNQEVTFNKASLNDLGNEMN